MADVTGSKEQEALATQENEELLALLQGQESLEPGDMAGEEVEHGKGSELSSRVSSVTSAGYIMVFDRMTGDSSVVNRNMLPTQLRKRHPDTHALVFTLVDPGIRPAVGTYRCMLHADSPEREVFDNLGLAYCKKANLKTAYQQTRHMTKRHKDEWALMQDIKSRDLDAEQKSDREQDREFQRMILDRLTGGTDARTYPEGTQEEAKQEEGEEVDGR